MTAATWFLPPLPLSTLPRHRRRHTALLSPLAPAPCRTWSDSTATYIPSVSCKWTIETHRGLMPQPSLVHVAWLLASVFSEEAGADGQDPPTPAELAGYQLRLMAALQFRGLTEGRQFVTVLARACNQGLDGEGDLAGIATIGPGLGAAGAEGHMEDLPEDHIIASITNMAVSQPWRRQGLGRKVLAAAEMAAWQWPAPPSMFALCVYRSNEPAIRLYESAGYAVDDSWTDPRWLHDAERGQVGRERRLLMLKKVESWEIAGDGI